jgi:acyl-coenzyme A thioesterase PaaI-like protein
MRAAAARRDLIAEARCYQLTRSVAFVRAWAFEDTAEDPVAAAQSAYMLGSGEGRGAGR